MSAPTGRYPIERRAGEIERLRVQAETIALNSVSALRFDDPQSAEETLSALRADRNIVAAAIYAADGNLFASYAGDGESPPVGPMAPETATGCSCACAAPERRRRKRARLITTIPPGFSARTH